MAVGWGDDDPIIDIIDQDLYYTGAEGCYRRLANQVARWLDDRIINKELQQTRASGVDGEGSTRRRNPRRKY